VKYGEKEIEEFDIDKDLEVWSNKHKKDYLIKIELPEFMCMCPRSGYPDFATIYIDYTPDECVVELKALKLYINSFSKRYISHEDSANEIYDTFIRFLKPKYLKIVADFNPRGNVHTIIELDSKVIDVKS
jgi:7-cyano-7-deazaguanine reductase